MKAWEAIARVIDTVQEYTVLVTIEPRSHGNKAKMVFSTRQDSDLQREIKAVLDAYAANPEEV